MEEYLEKPEKRFTLSSGIYLLGPRALAPPPTGGAPRRPRPRPPVHRRGARRARAARRRLLDRRERTRGPRGGPGGGRARALPARPRRVKVLEVVHGFPPDCHGGTESFVEGLSQGLASRGGRDPRRLGGPREPHARADEREPVEGAARRPDPPARLVLRDLGALLLGARGAPLRRDPREGEARPRPRPSLAAPLARPRRADPRGGGAGGPHPARLRIDLPDLLPRQGGRLLLHGPPRRRELPPPAWERPAGMEPAAAVAEIGRLREDLLREIGLARERIALSSSQASILSRVTGRPLSDFRVLPLGPVKRLRRAPHRPRGPGEPLRVISFGHLFHLKGQHLLLEAVRRARARERIRVALFGLVVYPEYEKRLRALAEGIAVEFRGTYEVQDLEGTDADLAVFPTLAAETYGFVLDEAAALGIPAAVPDLGGDEGTRRGRRPRPPPRGRRRDRVSPRRRVRAARPPRGGPGEGAASRGLLRRPRRGRARALPRDRALRGPQPALAGGALPRHKGPAPLDPSSLRALFEARLGGRVDLAIMENRSTVLRSIPKSGGVFSIRLHRIFLEAPREILEAAAGWLSRGGKRRAAAIDRYIEENLPRLPPPPPSASGARAGSGPRPRGPLRAPQPGALRRLARGRGRVGAARSLPLAPLDQVRFVRPDRPRDPGPPRPRPPLRARGVRLLHPPPRDAPRRAPPRPRSDRPARPPPRRVPPPGARLPRAEAVGGVGEVEPAPIASRGARARAGGERAGERHPPSAAEGRDTPEGAPTLPSPSRPPEGVPHGAAPGESGAERGRHRTRSRGIGPGAGSALGRESRWSGREGLSGLPPDDRNDGMSRGPLRALKVALGIRAIPAPAS